MPENQTKFVITFIPSGRGAAQCAPNPDYPEGIDLDTSLPGLPCCVVSLPYPAPECGAWHARCKECGLALAATAAGRPDDPRTVRVPCIKKILNN